MNELSNFHNSRTMSSREIAELTGKRHDNVVADIRRIIETLSNTTEMTHLRFQVSTYKDASGKSNVEYLLDYEATMLLVSGYNILLRAKVIRRWRELEAEKYEMQKVSSTPAQPPIREEIEARRFKAAQDILKTGYEMAQIFGLTGNQALLKADKVTRQLSNISPMALLEIELKSPDNEALMIATEVGKRLEPAISAKAVNLALAAMDFMERFEYRASKFEWRLTEKGKEYGVYLDTGKVHSNGTPIQQIKWQESVIPLIQQYLRVQG